MHQSIHCRANAIGVVAVFSMFAVASAVSAAQDAKAPDYEAIVASPDRSDADRQTDQRRQPARMLAFTDVKPGMKVLDMEANAGYSTELLARAVGPEADFLRHPEDLRDASVFHPQVPTDEFVLR
jgi:predicted methyltransferase